ncbi:hypothetical protein CASFOL_002265 [Castilleja foliolosa]|uniref:Uncharacterized protein n=1 Tax=Castilleja foliolosa TaxID=1961234 RepID=A0ABD3EHD6_9LAMI
MDHTFHESLRSFYPLTDSLKLEKLLEHLWFFSNILLDKKTNPIMSNTINASSNVIMSGKSSEETYKSIQKLSGGQDESWPSNLVRAPSLPPRVEKNDRNRLTNKIDDDPGRRLSSNEKNEECQDEESEFSMGKLIRQASLSNSESFPPRRQAANKGLTTSSSISRHGSITKVELGKLKGIRPQRPMKHLKTQKSLNDLVLYQELQGFKELGLDSESGPAQTSDRPDGKISAEDIKAQIKFWARAVASNVRQES